VNFPELARGSERRAATCHVYYRVRTERLPHAGKAVAELMNDLHARTGIRGSLSRRIERAQARTSSDSVAHGAPTWMETYAGIDDRAGFERHMEAAMQNAAFVQFLSDGTNRTLEWFEPLDVKAAA